MLRFAFSEPSIGSQTTRHGVPVPKTRSPSSSETSVKSWSSCSSRCTTAVSAAASIAVVSSPPSPCGEHRLALDARGQLGEHASDISDRVAAHLEPRGHLNECQSGWKSRPLMSLGKKYVVFCGNTSPRRA